MKSSPSSRENLKTIVAKGDLNNGIRSHRLSRGKKEDPVPQSKGKKKKKTLSSLSSLGMNE
jgi:hypothetical protein